MNERRKRIMKRLIIEELERREMLTATPEIAMAATGLTNNSLEDFYKSQVGTEIGGPAGVYMLDEDIQPVLTGLFFSTIDPVSRGPGTLDLDATTGVGQQTITTGANTPGIGSFASPTAGPSRAGGTGNPSSPLIGSLSAADAAMEQLFGDPDAEAVAKTNAEDGSDATERAFGEPALLGSKSIARRAWSISPDELEAEEASPEPATADR